MPKPLMIGDQVLDADRLEDIDFIDAVKDRFWVPGYSEARQENDMRISRGEEPIAMPRLNWIRVRSPDGKDVDYRDMVAWAQLQYKFCEISDLEENGWERPPTATVDSEGRFVLSDLALAICSAEDAQKNIERQRRVNREFHGRSSSDEDIQREELASGHGTLADAMKATNKVTSMFK